MGTLVNGAEGRQMFCYTNEIGNYLPPKSPGVEALAVKLLLYNTYMNNTYKETVFGLDQINTVTFADTQAVL